MMKRILIVAAVAAFASGVQGAIIFDDFNVDEGHFNVHPGYSGSTVGEDPASSADRVTTNGPLEGEGHQELIFIHDGSATNMRVRHLSGLGTGSNNVSFATSDGTDGWIGFFLKTTDPGWTAQLWIEGDGGANGGVPKDVIADGQWHVYEWNLDDTSGGADGWGSIAGIIGGSAVVGNGNHTIDSIVFRDGTGGAGEVNPPIYLDFVARSDAGSIVDLVPEPATLVLLGFGGLFLRRRRA